MKKIIVSKINEISSLRRNIPLSKNIDKPSGDSLNVVKCSETSDNLTTYVQDKIWSIELNNFIYPPYAECEYVD